MCVFCMVRLVDEIGVVIFMPVLKMSSAVSYWYLAPSQMRFAERLVGYCLTPSQPVRLSQGDRREEGSCNLNV